MTAFSGLGDIFLLIAFCYGPKKIRIQIMYSNDDAINKLV